MVVRVYELKSVTAFMQASFFELLDNDTQKLGAGPGGETGVRAEARRPRGFERDTPIETT